MVRIVVVLWWVFGRRPSQGSRWRIKPSWINSSSRLCLLYTKHPSAFISVSSKRNWLRGKLCYYIYLTLRVPKMAYVDRENSQDTLRRILRRTRIDELLVGHHVVLTTRILINNLCVLSSDLFVSSRNLRLISSRYISIFVYYEGTFLSALLTQFTVGRLPVDNTWKIHRSNPQFSKTKCLAPGWSLMLI